MKKLVALSAVMFFVVLGFAATSGAAVVAPNHALGAITGRVTIRSFDYPCAGAFVQMTPPAGAPAFFTVSVAANEVDTNPILGGACVTANSNGVYQYIDLDLPTLTPTTSTLRASWVLSMFGVTLQFDNLAVDSFNFANPIPGQTPLENVNIEVWPTGIIP